jgi:hypothetical protein
MVIKVALLLFCLLLTALAPAVHPGTAGNAALAYSAPYSPPPSCAPPPCPPPSCGPPSCGPGFGGPGAICGGILGACTNICGTLIGIPAAVMQGILAPPPPPRYRPPSGCGPTMCPPPMCGPPQCAPRPITKCKPVSYGPNPMPYGYAPAAAGPAPFIVPASSPPVSSFYMGPPVEQSGLSNMVSQMVQIPFRLVSGTLTAPGSPWGRDLFAAPPIGPNEAACGTNW